MFRLASRGCRLASVRGHVTSVVRQARSSRSSDASSDSDTGTKRSSSQYRISPEPYRVVSSRLSDTELSVDQLRRRLLYKAHYMGTRENILLMGSFAKQLVPTMNRQQLNEFAEILQFNDVELFNWITGPDEQTALAKLPEDVDTPVMRMLVKHVHSGKVETFS